jgi:hypothetical protein
VQLIFPGIEQLPLVVAPLQQFGAAKLHKAGRTQPIVNPGALVAPEKQHLGSETKELFRTERQLPD